MFASAGRPRTSSMDAEAWELVIMLGAHLYLMITIPEPPFPGASLPLPPPPPPKPSIPLSEAKLYKNAPRPPPPAPPELSVDIP